jgi:hypothetical protein
MADEKKNERKDIEYVDGKPVLIKDYNRAEIRGAEKKPEVLVKNYIRKKDEGQKLPDDEKPVELPYSVTNEAKPGETKRVRRLPYLVNIPPKKEEASETKEHRVRKLPYLANIPGESHPPEQGHTNRLSYEANVKGSEEGLEKIASAAGSQKVEGLLDAVRKNYGKSELYIVDFAGLANPEVKGETDFWKFVVKLHSKLQEEPASKEYNPSVSSTGVLKGRDDKAVAGWYILERKGV